MAWNLAVEPRPYQIEAANWALAGRQAVCCLPRGAGKTLVAILWLKHLFESGEVRRALILVTKRVTTARKLGQPFNRRQRRAYHRVMSGMEKRGDLRFLTLTSSPQSKRAIHRDFRTLVMRLRRRGLLEGYFQVKEYSKGGLVHMHIIIRGKYIAQALISKWWAEIHQAPVVDIHKVKGRKRAAARYVAKYIAKDLPLRWSASWSWVWKGFCRDWEGLKRLAKQYGHSWRWVMQLLRWHLQVDVPLDIKINS